MALNIRFYNTLTSQTEVFEPIEPPGVAMYSCGPTVYDYSQIGNFRTFIFADILRRFLELAGYDVRQVMNVTDVGHMTDDELADGGGEDKMQVGVQRLKQAKQQGKANGVENPDDPYQVARFFTDAFLHDAKLLGLKIADESPQRVPRASDHIVQMQAMIRRLIEKDHAYVADDGAVYYDVRTFPEYGRLSGNSLDQLRGGAGGRVQDEHQARKRHPADFLLWKPDASHIMKWDSPWGVGFPGWHIECSAMATHVLGRQVIDIHTGGEDNIFPHHECEIAQTCGVTGEQSFAHTWMHARYLLVDGEKMSKRTGTFFTVRDLTSGQATGRTVHPAIIRYELLRTHYRSNLNFTFKGLQDSAMAVAELRKVAATMTERANGQEGEVDVSHPVLKDFVEALADDLNISRSLAVVFAWLSKGKGNPVENLAVLNKIDSVLNVLRTPAFDEADSLTTGRLKSDDLNTRLDQINQARQEKDYDRADQLKQALRELDYDVMDTPKGTVAVPKPIVVDSDHAHRTSQQLPPAAC